jgi:hypothetical protein
MGKGRKEEEEKREKGDAGTQTKGEEVGSVRMRVRRAEEKAVWRSHEKEKGDGIYTDGNWKTGVEEASAGVEPASAPGRVPDEHLARRGEEREEKRSCSRRNKSMNRGWTSVDRSSKATLPLTVPRSGLSRLQMIYLLGHSELITRRMLSEASLYR